MKRKYIFISGGVISGIGKGIAAGSISFLLQKAGYKIFPIKFENYLNIDAGTINPIEHGDPFLCDDGAETDMDIGTYEKFLRISMGSKNFVTMGQIYKYVIDKERRFEYNGEDVEAIPHVTDEITRRINTGMDEAGADIAVIELGGTAGEYQNIFYYEANRIMALRNRGDVIHVHVSYIPTPAHLGEPKTKPVQLSVKTLNSMGIQPDILITRSEKVIDERRRERFSMFCNMHPQDIISSHDVKNIYEVPLVLESQNITENILRKLDLPVRPIKLGSWEKFLTDIKKIDKTIKVAIVGKYFKSGEYHLKDAYAALFDAIDHAGWANHTKVETVWVNAEQVEKDGPEKYLKGVDGVIVPIGWGERGAEGMIAAASYARRKKIPYLGLCYGMQLAVIAFARDVLGWKDANTEENDKKTTHKVIHMIPGQKELLDRKIYGGTMRLGSWEAVVTPGTYAWEMYDKYVGFIDKKKNLTAERHRHRYEFNDDFVSDFEKAGLIISARSKIENLAEIVELPRSEHPFYVGTQGHPEYKSYPDKPHPIFVEFIKVAGK